MSDALTPTIIRRLSIARYMFHLAIDNGRSAQDVTSHACINILQDAIEMFFVAATEHLNIPLSSRTDFPQYLDKVAENLGREIPYRRKLLEINRVRIASKHDGILPDKKELDTYILTTRQFFEEATEVIFNVDFWSISLIDLLDENREETKLLREAEQQFKGNNFQECLVICRRAFFVRFEESYNIKKFEKDDPSDFFRHMGTDAPTHARTPEYIKRHVSSPFDFIVRDHSKMDAHLMKEGIDHTTFWNIWRLTPEVYRYTRESEWMTKYEPKKYTQTDIKDSAAYVLDSTISVMLQLAMNQRAWRMLDNDNNHSITLRSGVIRIYAKADKESTVTNEFEISPGTIVLGNYLTPGLQGDGLYWNIGAFNKETKFFAYGYVPVEDIVTIE